MASHRTFPPVGPYKDKDGEWKTTSSYDQAHLLELAKAVDLAWDAIAALRKSDSEGHSPG
jgi:hypothetical protein